MTDPILVGMELSGRFVEIIIDLMERYPDEWQFDEKSRDVNRYSQLPTLSHSGGITIQVCSKQASGGVIVQIEENDLEGVIVSPAIVPMSDGEAKKLGGACVKLYKYLILKLLGYERLLKEDEDAE